MKLMTSKRKIRVAVLYGGRSGEHEVSLRSAASVIRELDRNKYEIIPVGITKQGHWLLNDLTLIEKGTRSGVLPLREDAPAVILPPHGSGDGKHALLPLRGASSGDNRPIEVVFPVLHGPLCEDGSVQGLLELADLPYVGSGVLGSAVAMDKDVAKKLVASVGIPIVPYRCFKFSDWERDPNRVQKEIENHLGFPVFVKPANLGSSVGVHKVKKVSEFKVAMEDAFQYDLKVLVEKGLSVREIEYSVLENIQENQPPQVSTAGEIIPQHEFYSYDAKYLDDNGAKLVIPADLSAAQMKEGQKMVAQIFEVLECESMARVDLFLEKGTHQFYFNELNTIPGFTSISMYPKLWEASGIGYTDLLDRLIQLAIKRHDRKKKLKREWTR